MMGQGKLDSAILVTHIGGLDVARETTLNLPKVPGGKKLVSKTNGLWNTEAEKYLLEHAPAV